MKNIQKVPNDLCHIVKYKDIDQLSYQQYCTIILQDTEYYYPVKIIGNVIVITGYVCDEHQLDTLKPNRRKGFIYNIIFENLCDDYLVYQALEKL